MAAKVTSSTTSSFRMSMDAPNKAKSQPSRASNLSNGSSTVTSLFERVTNFRRSLIKTNNKKKIRQTSGSVNPSVAKECQDNQSCIEPNLPQSTTTNVQKVSKSFQDKNVVLVDEEDAIYGFTSSHLSQTGTPLRRALKSSPPCEVSIPSPNASPPHHKNSSASCVSLYETIDEIDDSLPPPPGVDSPIRKAIAAGNDPETNESMLLDWKASRRSSAIIFGTDFYDYDREVAAINQASSSNHLHNSDRPAVQPKYFIKNNHYSQQATVSTTRYHPGPRCAARIGDNGLRRSSDDLLMMSHKDRSIPPLPTNRIYENLRAQMFAMAGSENVRHNSTASSSTTTASSSSSSTGHYHHPLPYSNRYRDNRKLTKDSGYESTSTLVSLSQLNASVVSAITVTPTTAKVIHARSDSIDSIGSASISAAGMQSLSPKARRSESPLPLPPPPIGSESPPPTPPVRFSSLAEQQTDGPWQLSFESMQRQHIDLICGRQLSQIDANNCKTDDSWPPPAASPSSSSPSSCGSQPPPPPPPSVYHTHDRSNAEENGLPYVEQHYFPPSTTVLAPKQSNVIHNPLGTDLHKNNQSLLQMNGELDHGEGEHVSPPTECSAPPPLPPKLQTSTSKHCDHASLKQSPTTTTNNGSDIKAIQKRALYEFYLRHKLKMDKAGGDSDNTHNNKKIKKVRQDCDNTVMHEHDEHSISPPSQVNANVTREREQEECGLPSRDDHNNNRDAIRESEDGIAHMPLPSPPTPLSPDPQCFVFAVQDEQENDDECCPPLPRMPPPPLCAEGTETGQDDFPAPPRSLLVTDLDEIAPPPPPEMVNGKEEHTPREEEEACHFYTINLDHLWPTINFVTLWPANVYGCNKPPLKMVKGDSNQHNGETIIDHKHANGTQVERDEDEDEELVGIERMHEQKMVYTSTIARLEAHVNELEASVRTNEQLGEWIRDRMVALLDNNNRDAGGKSYGSQDRCKLDLLCNDMMLVTRLMVSIMRQVANNERALAAADNDADDRIDKRDRLASQLLEAVALRDNIGMRRFILEARLNKSLANITRQRKINCGDDVDLASLLHHYLARKETLLVQLEVASLVLDDVRSKLC